MARWAWAAHGALGPQCSPCIQFQLHVFFAKRPGMARAPAQSFELWPHPSAPGTMSAVSGSGRFFCMHASFGREIGTASSLQDEEKAASAPSSCSIIGEKRHERQGILPRKSRPCRRGAHGCPMPECWFASTGPNRAWKRNRISSGKSTGSFPRPPSSSSGAQSGALAIFPENIRRFRSTCRSAGQRFPRAVLSLAACADTRSGRTGTVPEHHGLQRNQPQGPAIVAVVS